VDFFPAELPDKQRLPANPGGDHFQGTGGRAEMARRKLRVSCYPVKLTAFFSLFLGAVLLAATACTPLPKAPPPIKTPSKVITEGGYEFFVYGLKLPGSRQEVKLKKDDTLTWLPLSTVQFITFTGPEADRFRPADIMLLGGEKLQGELFVDQIIEGTTDLGYWNTRMANVRQISMGEE
jgi:hypothetical protein